METREMIVPRRASALPYLIGGVSGLALGAALGVLFAPEPGSETRRKVAGWLKDKRAQGKRWIAARRHGGRAEETRELFGAKA
jgi:gas vesicle protein